MRFPFFPTPAEGETIYSAFCRCAERSGLPQEHVVSYLTCQGSIRPLCSALPGYLKTLASSLPTGHPWTNPERAVRLHTAMPYYTYFNPPMRRNEAVQALANNDFCQVVFSSLGLQVYRCGASPKHVRFCIECNKENEAALGFSYFRREHQLPAVVVCWKHGCILSNGCRTCGPYPIPKRGLSMPGRCLCPGEQSPLPVVEELPGDPAILKWLACESAYMVSVDGTQCPCVIAKLRQQARNHGLCRGSLVVYADIATALEKRFGVILNWLGYPAWTNGQPSAWIRMLLLPSREETRKPTIVLLLLVGLLNSSVDAFEAWSGISGDDSLGGKTIEVAEWRAKLPRLLASHSFKLTSVALRLGVSPDIVAVEAIKQDIRIPLSQRAAMRLGQEKLESIRSGLCSGVSRNQLARTHGVSLWTIQLIELDNPRLRIAGRAAATKKIRDAHRQRVLDLIASDPNASRIRLLQGTCNYLLEHDKEWFQKTLPKQRHWPRPGARRLDRAQLDSVIAGKVRDIISELKSMAHRPTRITKSGVLRRAGYLKKYLTAPKEFPRTEALLREHVENQADYLVRKIRWAVAEMARDGQVISLNFLRRKAGLSGARLREYKQLVLEMAQQLGANVAPHSFFAQDT
jgi:hypothetical protein